MKHNIFNFLQGINRTNLAMIVLLLGAVLFASKQCSDKNRYKNLYSSSTQEIKTKTEVLSRFTDSAGRNHFVVKDNVIPAKNAKQQLAASGGIIDTVSQALKIARERITELTRVNAQLVAENLKATSTPTTTSTGRIVNVWRYKDKYADLSFNEADTTFGLKYNLDLKTVGYRDKSWFLAQPIDVLDLYSEDKRVTINGVERFRVETPDPTFGLKVQGKSVYNFRTKSISAGPSAEVNIGRLSVEGNYLFNTKEAVWNPSVAAKWDIYIAK